MTSLNLGGKMNECGKQRTSAEQQSRTGIDQRRGQEKSKDAIYIRRQRPSFNKDNGYTPSRMTS